MPRKGTWTWKADSHMFSSHLMSPAREERSTFFPAFGKDSLLHGAIVSGEWRLITAVGWSGGIGIMTWAWVLWSRLACGHMAWQEYRSAVLHPTLSYSSPAPLVTTHTAQTCAICWGFSIWGVQSTTVELNCVSTRAVWQVCIFGILNVFKTGNESCNVCFIICFYHLAKYHEHLSLYHDHLLLPGASSPSTMYPLTPSVLFCWHLPFHR